MNKRAKKEESHVSHASHDSHASHKEVKIEDKILDNLIALQKAETGMVEKFDKLSDQLSKLLSLFETAARNFAQSPSIKTTEKDSEFLAKINSLLEQNKTIAKGLTLMEERIKERVYGAPQPSDQEYYSPEPANRVTDYVPEPSNRSTNYPPEPSNRTAEQYGMTAADIHPTEMHPIEMPSPEMSPMEMPPMEMHQPEEKIIQNVEDKEGYQPSGSNINRPLPRF